MHSRMSSVCPSVCPSLTSVDHDHIGWESWKLIVRTISPTSSLFVAQGSSTYSQGNIEKFCGENVRSTPTSIMFGWIESTKSCDLRSRCGCLFTFVGASRGHLCDSIAFLLPITYFVLWCHLCSFVCLVVCYTMEQTPHFNEKTDWHAVKGCCIWLNTLDPQQQFPGEMPFWQVAVTVQFKMASKMATAALHPCWKKTQSYPYNSKKKC